MEKINSLINFGIININKPSGPTSFSITEFVRQKLNLKKSSHMGTLDPKVTGVLPITLGRACRLSRYFMHHKKCYVGVLHTHKEKNLTELQKIINKKFTGKIKQIPPHKSAVKRVERERTIYKFDFLEDSENKKDFLFYCEVEGGTYIRKLCSDLGEIIKGAHMAELRRTQAGIFDENKMFNLYEFEEAVEEYKKGNSESLKKMITPAEESIKKVLPFIKVKEEAVKDLHTGKPLLKEDVLGKSEIKEESFAVFCRETFIGIYRKAEEKDILGRAEFVKN